LRDRRRREKKGKKKKEREKRKRERGKRNWINKITNKRRKLPSRWLLTMKRINLLAMTMISRLIKAKCNSMKRNHHPLKPRVACMFIKLL